MRFLVVFALLASIPPGTAEVIETVIHLVVHADLPHHEDEEPDCEHSCTPLAHRCICHSGMSAQTPNQTTMVLATAVVTKLHAGVAQSSNGRASEPPPLRPPIV